MFYTLQLKDFITSAMVEASSADGEKHSWHELAKQANQIYKANYVVPKHTLLRFDSSITLKNSFRFYHLSLFFNITRDHPYFRPYLKKFVMRQICHLYLLESNFTPPTSPYDQYGPETELDTILNDAEKCIIDRVIQFEDCIHTVNEIAAQHGLSPESIAQLLDAMNYMVKHSPYDRDYLLSEENRNGMLRLTP